MYEENRPVCSGTQRPAPEERARTLDRRRDMYTLLSNIIVVVIITTESNTRSTDDGFVPSMGYRGGDNTKTTTSQ